MRWPRLIARAADRLTAMVRALRQGQAPSTQPVTAAPAEQPAPPVTPAMRIRHSDVGALNGVPSDRIQAFDVLRPAPGVVGNAGLAMDESVSSLISWAGSDALDEGIAFLGYPYLSQLTQRAEYRRPSEILAKEMTRQWIRFTASGSDDKSEKLRVIEGAFKRLGVQDAFRRCAELDGFFGRGHIFIDVDDKRDPEELQLPLSVSKYKIRTGGKLALRVVEPLWTYPDAYNATDPLAPDFYRPQRWHVMGKIVHASRMLTLISRDVPDMLKPAYAFGGLSLSQIAKPYVDNWLRTRQSVSDLLHNFSVMVLQTNMAAMLGGGGGEQVALRAKMFNLARDNHGLMMLDKDTEGFQNIAAPLGGLDHLQAQSQEQMAAVTGIPLVILLGITPSGLNASSDGEIKTFYAWVHSQQETIFRPPLRKVLDIVQLAEFGEIDPEIDFEFEPLHEESPSEQAATEKTKAETDSLLIDKGVISPHEARVRLASDPDSHYQALDVADDPVPPVEGDDEGAGGQQDDAQQAPGLGSPLPVPAA